MTMCRDNRAWCKQKLAIKVLRARANEVVKQGAFAGWLSGELATGSWQLATIKRWTKKSVAAVISGWWV